MTCSGCLLSVRRLGFDYCTKVQTESQALAQRGHSSDLRHPGLDQNTRPAVCVTETKAQACAVAPVQAPPPRLWRKPRAGFGLT